MTPSDASTADEENLSELRTQNALHTVVTVLSILVACAIIGIVCNVIGIYKIAKTEKTLSTPRLPTFAPPISPRPKKPISPWADMNYLETMLADSCNESVRSTISAEEATVEIVSVPCPPVEPTFEAPLEPSPFSSETILAPSLLTDNTSLVSPPQLTPMPPLSRSLSPQFPLPEREVLLVPVHETADVSDYECEECDSDADADSDVESRDSLFVSCVDSACPSPKKSE
jgi:hypothetical protein